MWFGVDRGVQRYDGVHWRLYTPDDGLHGAPVRTLLGTRNGSVYAGSARGISRFREGVWQRVFPHESDVPWPTYDLMEAQDGAVWAATGWGALRLGQADTTLFTSKDVALAVQVIRPDLHVFVVPAPVRLWAEGIGVAVVRGDEIRDLGNVPWVVSGLAPGGLAKLWDSCWEFVCCFGITFCDF